MPLCRVPDPLGEQLQQLGDLAASPLENRLPEALDRARLQKL
jgi:hypothetical protein